MTQFTKVNLSIPAMEQKKLKMMMDNDLPMQFKVDLKGSPNQSFMLTPSQINKIKKASKKGQKMLQLNMSKSQLKKNKAATKGAGFFGDLFKGIAQGVAVAGDAVVDSFAGDLGLIEKATEDFVFPLLDKADDALVDAFKPKSKKGKKGKKKKLQKVGVNVPKQKPKIMKGGLKMVLDLQKEPSEVLALEKDKVEELMKLKEEGQKKIELELEPEEINQSIEAQFDPLAPIGGGILTDFASVVEKGLEKGGEELFKLGKKGVKKADKFAKKTGKDIEKELKKLRKEFKGGALTEEEVENKLLALESAVNQLGDSITRDIDKLQQELGPFDPSILEGRLDGLGDELDSLFEENEKNKQTVSALAEALQSLAEADQIMATSVKQSDENRSLISEIADTIETLSKNDRDLNDKIKTHDNLFQRVDRSLKQIEQDMKEISKVKELTNKQEKQLDKDAKLLQSLVSKTSLLNSQIQVLQKQVKKKKQKEPTAQKKDQASRLKKIMKNMTKKEQRAFLDDMDLEKEFEKELLKDLEKN